MIFLKPYVLRVFCFLQHVSPLAMEALPSNIPLHMLPIQRHKCNIKKTEVRIHVNICKCSIKSYFLYWPLRIHLGLTLCHVCNIFTKPCKNGHLMLNSPVCKLFYCHYSRHLQEYKRQFIYPSKTATIIILSYILLKLLAVKHAKISHIKNTVFVF